MMKDMNKNDRVKEIRIDKTKHDVNMTSKPKMNERERETETLLTTPAKIECSGMKLSPEERDGDK